MFALAFDQDATAQRRRETKRAPNMIGMMLGGVGLFLLGMALLTDGLQLAAGDRLREALRRYTRTRLSSVLTGALSTAVVQSSSATTLLTIGFVGAGMLSLTSALGVVFGANLGTTLTAWIVSAVGLKVKMNTFALPLVGIGALIRLFTRGKRAAVGSALAGFGLIFVGIDVLQASMDSVSNQIDLAKYAGRGPLTLVLMVIVGVIMTVVMQSSSAAVATTLAAVDGGTIGIIQAAALVIGQNIGTTVTAGIGAIGGSAAVRRIAVAHLIFNVVTAVLALGLFPVLWAFAGERIATRDPAIVISAFHTAFNLLGLLVFIPFMPKLAAMLERRIPERGAELTRRLATGRGASPSAVLEACRLTTHAILGATLRAAVTLLSKQPDEGDAARDREAVALALDATREKLSAVRGADEAADEHRRHIATLHALDHLYRLAEALGERDHIPASRGHEPTVELVDVVVQHFGDLARWADTHESQPPDIAPLSQLLADTRRAERPKILERIATGDLEPTEGDHLLEAMRWIDRLAYHVARAQHHLERADRMMPQAPPPAPESAGRRGDESYDAQG